VDTGRAINNMVTVRFWISAVVCFSFLGTAVSVPQTIDDRIISEHIRIRIPLERQWLGRDTISDLERCWKFMAAATDNSLPRQALVTIQWDNAISTADFRSGTISIGMGDPAAASDLRAFVVHNAARQLARLGLSYLSQGAAFREDTEFLAEGMAEILVREYEHTARSLGTAWVVACFLDDMKLLGLSAQAPWTAFSGGKLTPRATAPGVTFLITCRELHGRDKLPKLFAAMSNRNLEQSLAAVFRTSAASLETAWLQRVRASGDTEDIILTSLEDAPQLQQVTMEPANCRPGNTLQFRLAIRDNDKDLSSDGVFLRDEGNGRIVQARQATEAGVSFFKAEVAIEVDRRPGDYGYAAIAVDGTGNLRHWRGSYQVSQ
jgi:hypothetical protein